MVLTIRNIQIRWPYDWAALSLVAVIVALALSRWSLEAVVALSGPPGWMSTIRNTLIDWGLPIRFVTAYVSFALLRAPQWCLLAATTFALGLTHKRWAHRLAWVVSLSTPIADIVNDVLPSGSWWGGSPDLVADPKLRLISATGALIGVIAWWLAYLVRGRHAQTPGLCPSCGYDLQGSPPGPCPECGSSTR